MSDADPSKLRLDDSKINRGEIALLLNTRGRPQKMVQVLDSLRRTTVDKARVSLWLCVDDDDEPTLSAKAAGTLPDPGFHVHWNIGPRPQDWDQPFKDLWKLSGRTAEIYMLANDDVRFETVGWDNVVRDSFKPHPDGVVLACPFDPVAPDIATFPIVGWGWFQTIEAVYSGYFFYWFEDKWLDEIGRMIGRYIRIPILLSPIGGKGKTQRMKCLPFWARFFQLTLKDRKDLATRLINNMNLPDEKARAAALAAMEEAAAEFKKEENVFSDIYQTFREERHTAWSPEERNKFSLIYFKQEAKAVSIMMAHAQECFVKKDYAGAMTYLDATQLSELRSRTIQLMKIDCLRALDRHTEADQVAKASDATWPQMNFARRIFRLLGSLASETKNLFVGATDTGKAKPIK